MEIGDEDEYLLTESGNEYFRSSSDDEYEERMAEAKRKRNELLSREKRDERAEARNVRLRSTGINFNDCDEEVRPEDDVIHVGDVKGEEPKKTISNEQKAKSAQIVDRKRKLENSLHEQLELRKKQKEKEDAEMNARREEQMRVMLALEKVARAADESHEAARQVRMAKHTSLQEFEETREAEREMHWKKRMDIHEACRPHVANITELEKRYTLRMQGASNKECAIYKAAISKARNEIDALDRSLLAVIEQDEKSRFNLFKEQQSAKEAKEDEEAKKVARVMAGRNLADHPLSKIRNFSRECDICKIINPVDRACLTKCGHIVCYLCAVQLRSEAEQMEKAIKCPMCREESEFVMTVEVEVEQRSEEEKRVLRALEDVALAADGSHMVARHTFLAMQARLHRLENTRATEEMQHEQKRENVHQKCFHLYMHMNPVNREMVKLQIEELHKSLQEAITEEEYKKAIFNDEKEFVKKAKEDEEAKRMARQTAGNDFANHPLSMARVYDRKCTACATINPVHRACMTGCGHFLCYLCALQKPSEEDQEENTVKCDECGEMSQFVKAFE